MQTTYFPTVDNWDTLAPADAGMDEAALAKVVAFAGEQNSTGLIITRHGRIVVEQYWQGWDASTSDRIFSSTKSIMATLVGAAIEDGYMEGVDQARFGTPANALNAAT